MTNKEAAQILKDLETYITLNTESNSKARILQAIKKAVDALECAVKWDTARGMSRE